MIRKPNFKLNWKYALGELLLIFLGISLAIGFQNWNEDRKQKLEAKAIIERLLLEVKENQTSIDSTIHELENTLLHIEGLLSRVGPNYQQYDVTLIDSLIFNMFGTPEVILGNGTLLEGISSGKIALIPSEVLRSKLYSWQKLVDAIRSDEEVLIQESATILFPFIIDKFSFRQMDSKFGPAKSRIGKSRLPYFDNRKILSYRKFENLMDNKFFTYNNMRLAYISLANELEKIEVGLQDLLK
jgi:hypothetical protein